MQLQRAVKYLQLALAGAAVSAAALLAVPLCDVRGSVPARILAVMVALLFWGGLILEQVFFWMANAERKQLPAKHAVLKRLAEAPMGAVTFGSNREAHIADVVMCVSAVITAAMILFQIQNAWLVIPCAAVLLLSFNLHCIFNGRNYRYIKLLQKTTKEQRKNENTNQTDE